MLKRSKFLCLKLCGKQQKQEYRVYAGSAVRIQLKGSLQQMRLQYPRLCSDNHQY